MASHFPLLILAMMFASGASGECRTSREYAATAGTHPHVVAALEAADRIDAAILAGDTPAVLAFFTSATVVNSPFNTVSDRAEAERRFASGALTYLSLCRSIEYAAPRGDHEVLLMGEEIYEPPPGHPLAGKIVRRRFTDLWVLADGEWKIGLRQATVVSAQ